MIVDDRIVRIGSSNASSRAMGLDTECDLVIEARQSHDNIETVIRQLRRRLLGEHLNCPVERVAEVESEQNGLIAAIEALRSDGRSLRELDCSVPAKVDEMVPDSGLIDPSEPVSPDYFVSEYVPEQRRPVGRRRLLAFLALIAVLLALAAMWRWTPLQEWLSPQRLRELFMAFPTTEVRAAVAVGAMALASLLMVPIPLLAVMAGVVFEGWQAFAYVLTGAVASAALGFVGGRIFQKDAIERFSGTRVAQLSKRLSKRGTVAVAVFRVVPIAPFAIFNLVAGASHLGFRQFLLGSVLGMAPGLAAITLFSNTLWSALTAPSWANVTIAVLVGIVLVGFALLAKRWLRSG